LRWGNLPAGSWVWGQGVASEPRKARPEPGIPQGTISRNLEKNQ
jgi:hypothetical protein